MGKNRPKMFCILSAKKYTRLYKAVGVMTNMLFYMGYWYFHVDELKFVAGEDIHGFPRVISSMTEATYFTKHGERHNRRMHQVLKLYQENMYQHKLRPHHQHSNCVKITKKYFRRSLLKRGARAKTRSKSLFTRWNVFLNNAKRATGCQSFGSWPALKCGRRLWLRQCLLLCVAWFKSIAQTKSETAPSFTI